MSNNIFGEYKVHYNKKCNLIISKIIYIIIRSKEIDVLLHRIKSKNSISFVIIYITVIFNNLTFSVN